MRQSSKQTFLGGAFVLIIANAVVKVIGAVFKIPLTNLIGADGIGIFSVAYNLYTAMFVLSTAGLPVAIAKMVSEANALGRQKEVVRIFRTALVAFVTIGAIGSGVMLIFAKQFVALVGNPLAYYSVLAIAPSIFFVAVMSTYRGYYQGLANMYPTAISQVIEAVLKLMAGYFLAYVIIKQGLGIEVAAAGAIAGVTIGTAMGSIYLVHFYKNKKRVRDNKTVKYHDGSVLPKVKTRSNRQIFAKLITIAVPVTIGASVLSLTNLIDMVVVINRLQDIGFDKIMANHLYGAYNMSLALFNLPQTLIVALAISIIPAVSSSYAKKNMREASKTIASATRITVLLALPSAAGLTVLSRPILDLLYYKQPDDVIIAAPLLALLGIAVLFVAMVSLTNSVLQATGNVNIPVLSMFIGGVVKLVANYILVGNIDINIHGAPIGTALCYGTITIINFAAISRVIKRMPSFFTTFVKPAFATLIMSVVSYFSYDFFSGLVGDRLGVIIAIGLSVIAYILALIVVKAVHRDDVILLPYGDKISNFLSLE